MANICFLSIHYKKLNDVAFLRLIILKNCSGNSNETLHWTIIISLFLVLGMVWGFPGCSEVKASACNMGDPGSILGQENPLEKGMATHSSIFAWRTPWTEEPVGLQSMGSQRVAHDWTTNTSSSLWVHHLTFTLDNELPFLYPCNKA